MIMRVTELIVWEWCNYAWVWLEPPVQRTG